MSISKYVPAVPWTQTLAQEMTKPVFPRISPAVRPYLLAVMLFAASSTLLFIGGTAIPHSGIAWVLVSLLVTAAAARFWGVRPAALVLSLSTVYGVTVVPHVVPLFHAAPPPYVLLMLALLFAACGAAIIWLTYQARLMQDKAEARREVVRALQSMLLPVAPAKATGYDLSGLYSPANGEEEVGGDFYDFYATGTGHYCVLIGDVMGQGKEAAASTALLRYSVRAFCSAGAQPAEMITRLNTLIETQGLPFETASLFVGLLEPQSGRLRYANAGHEPPMLVSAAGEERVLGSTGPILGIGLGAAYDEAAIVLGPKDTLLLVTDGVTEARNKHGEFLGSAGAWWMLRTVLGMPSAQLALASMNAALADYIGGSRRDDIAMLLLRRTGA